MVDKILIDEYIDMYVENRNFYKQLQIENAKKLTKAKNKLDRLLYKLSRSDKSALVKLCRIINKNPISVNKMIVNQNSDCFDDLFNKLSTDINVIFENSEYFDDTDFTPRFTYEAVFCIRNKYFYFSWSAELIYDNIYNDYNNYDLFEYSAGDYIITTISNADIELFKYLIDKTNFLTSQENQIKHKDKEFIGRLI